MTPTAKLRGDWSVEVRRVRDLYFDATERPLGTLPGVRALASMLDAGTIWRSLTRPQRELLLSACAGAPVTPRADVLTRMVAHGLVTDDLTPTDAGRFVVRWRPL